MWGRGQRAQPEASRAIYYIDRRACHSFGPLRKQLPILFIGSKWTEGNGTEDRERTLWPNGPCCVFKSKRSNLFKIVSHKIETADIYLCSCWIRKVGLKHLAQISAHGGLQKMGSRLPGLRYWSTWLTLEVSHQELSFKGQILVLSYAETENSFCSIWGGKSIEWEMMSPYWPIMKNALVICGLLALYFSRVVIAVYSWKKKENGC